HRWDRHVMRDGIADAPTPFRRILRRIAAVLLGVSGAFIAASPAQAATVSWSGELGPGEATWVRPNCSGGLFGMKWWQAQAFSVDTAGSYTLEMTAASGPGSLPDGYFLLYENSFVAANPLVNCIANDDDSGTDFLPRIERTLQPGVTYFLVTTQWVVGAEPGREITYTNEITGPGNIT